MWRCWQTSASQGSKDKKDLKTEQLKHCPVLWCGELSLHTWSSGFIISTAITPHVAPKSSWFSYTSPALLLPAPHYIRYENQKSDWFVGMEELWMSLWDSQSNLLVDRIYSFINKVICPLNKYFIHIPMQYWLIQESKFTK